MQLCTALLCLHVKSQARDLEEQYEPIISCRNLQGRCQHSIIPGFIFWRKQKQIQMTQAVLESASLWAIGYIPRKTKSTFHFYIVTSFPGGGRQWLKILGIGGREIRIPWHINSDRQEISRWRVIRVPRQFSSDKETELLRLDEIAQINEATPKMLGSSCDEPGSWKKARAISISDLGLNEKSYSDFDMTQWIITSESGCWQLFWELCPTTFTFLCLFTARLQSHWTQSRNLLLTYFPTASRSWLV